MDDDGGVQDSFAEAINKMNQAQDDKNESVSFFFNFISFIFFQHFVKFC